MSRRLRRDLHKRISSAGYQKIAGDLEVMGHITGPTISDLFAAIQVLGGTTHSPVQLTITRCEGAYKSIIIQWQAQYNLSTFSHYEIQVSSDDTNWYSLEFDGTDWKDTLDAVTSTRAALMVHVPIPFGGTAENPTAVTLYYRVRQATIDGTKGTWSASASATTSLIQTGDIAANAITATKILAGTITASQIDSGTLQALFAAVSYVLTIGYAGTGTPASPDEGDRRIYLDDDEILFQIYTDGAWSTERQIALGGVDGNGNFRPFLGCRGILGDITDSPLLDPIPTRQHHLYKFDNDKKNQYGLDPWTVNIGAAAYSAGVKWEGTHSLHPAGALNMNYGGDFSNPWAAGDSVTAAFMFRFASNSFGHALIEWNAENLDDHIYVSFNSTRKIKAEINKGGTETSVYSDALAVDTWHFVAITYDATEDKCYVRVNADSWSFTPDGAWGAGNKPFYLSLGAVDQDEYMDDLLLSFDTAMDPDLFFQHVNRNVAWTSTYFAPDLLLKPRTNGHVVVESQLGISGASRVRATNSNSQSIADATDTVIQYNTETFDNLGEWDTSNYRFTPQADGYYQVSAAVLFASAAWAANELVGLHLYKNGAVASTLFYERMPAALTCFRAARGSDLIYLTINDYIDLRIYHNRGAATALHNQAQYNHVAIHRLS